MHISIPNTEEVLEEVPGSKGPPTAFQTYNIHINGTFHCSVRYSALRLLHLALKKKYGAGCLESFPSKSLFYLSGEDVNSRRYHLQRWLQRIGGQQVVVQGEIFQTFLLNAQEEVKRAEEIEVQVEIFLANGKSVKLAILSTDQTDDVLEKVRS